MDVVVVESPAKAKTINKYLGKGYKVLASYGHVRDLPSKDGSVQPDEDFAMAWELTDRSDKPVKEIVAALKGADTLYLATDPDREGEAISWHIEEILKERAALKGIDVKRVVFNEITADAVRDAFRHPRELHSELIEAYLARRALDYLVGFTLSPVLWRKLPGARSAGRVQSVALRLICERETEIEIFNPQEYWDVAVAMKSSDGDSFVARLTHLNGDKLDKFSLGSEADANAAKAAIDAQSFTIGKIEKQRVKRRPQPPFTTSTLQQEASRKLRFSATQTMRVAQRLYEGVDIGGETIGLITYMRTDSVVLSQEAIRNSRELISEDFGGRYLPESARIYKTKAKNAQEAHEAIRPTDFFRRPASLSSVLKEDEKKLYDLIWRRTVAAEMSDAELDKTAVDLPSADQQIRLRANGSVVAFDGFLKLYREDQDETGNKDTKDDDDRRLPLLHEGDAADKQSIDAAQHFTQPPPRYSEASLVRRLEELGIGRPSTYASILQVLQDREYVVLDRRRFVPQDKGRIVTSFLTSFFKRYVEYDFTAKLEEQLDDISGGRIDWKQVLRDFWEAFSATAAGTKELRTRAVIDALDAELGQHFFPVREDGSEPRSCPSCDDGRLGLKVGRHGPFIGCSNYPECKYTRRLTDNGNGADDAEMAAGPKVLGVDPATGKEVSLRKGPYGTYAQLGEEELDGKKKIKPKRSSIPRGVAVADVDFEMALKLLQLPRDIGAHPEDGVMMQAGIGRFGPFVKHGTTYVSLQDPMEVFSVGINRAVTLIGEKGSRGGRQAAKPLREIGAHPKDGKPVSLYAGRYGPYVKHGRINASLTKGQEPETVTLEQAVELLDARAAKGGRKKTTTKAKTAKPKKAAAKKTATKKPAAKRTTKAKTGKAGQSAAAEAD